MIWLTLSSYGIVNISPNADVAYASNSRILYSSALSAKDILFYNTLSKFSFLEFSFFVFRFPSNSKLVSFSDSLTTSWRRDCCYFSYSVNLIGCSFRFFLPFLWCFFFFAFNLFSSFYVKFKHYFFLRADIPSQHQPRWCGLPRPPKSLEARHGP